MIQAWKPDILTRLYVYSLCLLVYAAADVSWLFAIPRPPLYILVFILSVLKAASNGMCFSPKKTIWIIIWLICNIVFIFINKGGFISYIFRVMYFWIMTSVILLSLDEMNYLLKILTNCFVIILVISIPAWILYLLGVPLAHTGPHYHENGFHIYYDYYFFTTSINWGADYNRFSSVFLEPGQMATPCVFLFHLNSKENKLFQFKNVIMILGILLSLSLIAYGLFISSLVVNRMGEARFRVPVLILTLLVIVGVGQYFISHEDNAVNALIVSRLEYDEETVIKGYNRTNDYFDMRYDQMMQSSDKYFGIQDELRGNNWTYNTSGYKKYIVHNGIVGFAIVIIMMLVLLLDNKNRAALIYCIMVIVAFLVRDMLTTPLWMTCAIIGMYILGNDSNKEGSPHRVIIDNN